MTKFVTAELALGLMVSMAVGVGLAGAHDKVPTPIMTSETIDSLRDPRGGSQANDGVGAELEGTLEILHEDREDGSSHDRHFLLTHDGKRSSLEGVQHPDLLTGDRVRVKGVRSGQTLQLQTTSTQNLEVVQYAPLSNTLGLQKIVIVMVNFSNDPSHPATIASVKLDMARSDAFFRENSYGQTWLSVDVFGWYTLPIANTNCDQWAIKASADQAASASGVNLSAYTRRVYLFPWTSNCHFSGMGTVGGSPSTAWINGPEQLFVIDHELGHNLGLWHSHSISCPPAVLGPTCTTLDYGDSTDTMGGSGGHYNAFQKQRLGWLGYGVSPPITSVQTGGTYTIAAYEAPGTAPKALKIQRGPASAQAFFFVEFRTPTGLDAFLPSSGVFIHMASDNNSNSSYLLDMTPETQFAWYYEFLAVGKSFTDPASGITIQTVSVSGTSAMIAVTMGDVPPSLPSTPTALAGGPQLTWTPGTPVPQTGFVVERAPGPTAAFASIATTTAPSYFDTNGVAGQCYRVLATNASGTSGPSNVACATANPPGGITLTITTNSPIGREMTFGGTLSGSTSLSATIDGIAVAAKYVVVDATRKTWRVKVTGLFPGSHTFTVASGMLVASKSFTVLGNVPPSPPSTPTALTGGPQLTWTPGMPVPQTGFVVERAPGPTAAFASIATTTAPSYLDANGVAGQCYRVRATNAAGTSAPSNVACVPTLPPPPPGDVTLTITTNSPIGREMTFGGTLTGSTNLSATIDNIAIAAKYVVVDGTRKTWSVKVTALFPGPHTLTVASGAVAASTSFTVLK